MDDLIEAVREGRWRPGPDRAPVLANAPVARIEASTVGIEAGLIEAAGLARPFALIDDPNTRVAMGDRIARALRPEGRLTLERPNASLEAAEELARELAREGPIGGLIAVGSGVIADLGKWAADTLEAPLCVFATAPSMNGYLSATASLRADGVKRSFAVDPPRAAIFDLETLRSAPPRLARAGFADVLCRTTAQSDQRLARCLRAIEHDDAPHWLLQRAEAELVRRADGVGANDADAIYALTRAIVLSGYGMAIAGSSAPASQGEHAIAHLLDAAIGEDWDALHGETIALTTRAMAELQTRLLGSKTPPALEPAPLSAEELAPSFGPAAASAAEVVARKTAMRQPIGPVAWSDARGSIAAIARTPSEIEALFERAGLARSDLGVDEETFRRAMAHGRAVRDRWTALDLAAEAGAL